jgi:hypothetical protein
MTGTCRLAAILPTDFRWSWVRHWCCTALTQLAPASRVMA